MDKIHTTSPSRNGRHKHKASERGSLPPDKDLLQLYNHLRSFHVSYVLDLCQHRKPGVLSSPSSPRKCTFRSIACRQQRRASLASTSTSTQSRRSRARKSRRSSIFMYRPRQNAFSRKYHAMANTKYYKILSMFLGLTALFAPDICIAFLPKHMDFYVLDVGLLTIFAFLCVEWILYSIAHYNYFLTFFFWLDIVGTISIIFDIPFIAQHLFEDEGNTRLGSDNQRYFQLLQMMRMSKLFRLIHLFKQSSRGQLTQNHPKDVIFNTLSDTNTQRKSKEDMFDATKSDHIMKPVQMGVLIGDNLIQKLMLGILCIFFLMPMFSVVRLDFHTKTQYELDNISTFYTLHQSEIDGVGMSSAWQDYQHLVTRFKQYNSNAIYLQLVSANDNTLQRTEINDQSAFNALRSIEKFSVFHASSIAVLNMKDSVKWESLLNIGLISTMMVVLLIGSVVIKSDFSRLLVSPQRYLLKTLQVLSDIVVRRLRHSVDIDPAAFIQTVLTANTDVFFGHRRQNEFLMQLQDPSTSADEELDDSNVDASEDGLEMQRIVTANGIRIDADNEDDSIFRQSQESLNTRSTDHLLSRYLGNSRPSLEIDFDDGDMET